MNADVGAELLHVLARSFEGLILGASGYLFSILYPWSEAREPHAERAEPSKPRATIGIAAFCAGAAVIISHLLLVHRSDFSQADFQFGLFVALATALLGFFGSRSVYLNAFEAARSTPEKTDEAHRSSDRQAERAVVATHSALEGVPWSLDPERHFKSQVADETSEIYRLVRDFITQPGERPKQPLETKLDALPNVTAQAVVEALHRLGVVAKAADAGVGGQAVLELARRLKPNEELTLEQAVVEVSAAVETAIDVTKKGARGSNLDDLVDAVRSRIAEKTRAGDFDGAARDADQGFADWECAEAERRDASVRSGIALLEAGLEQDILRRDAPAAARRVEKIVGLEHPEDADSRFATLRQRLNTFHVHGRDKGINFHLLVAIEIARLALALAQGPEQRGGALIDLGNALNTLGERESGTAKLEDAVAAYREALKERTRERVPLDWAATQNNLGNALGALGARESGTAKLEDAIAAYREALKERTRERVPLDWAATQNNLGYALELLGGRESGTAKLEDAVAAYREALKERTRERVPLDWAATQNNLGNALGALGARESGTAKLEDAVATYREALKERTRKRVPLDWAATQNNLGYALRALGARESGTAKLEDAVAAHREALKEWTRERVPLDWARTFGNEGLALMHLAEQRGDVAMAETALSQINTAFRTTRDGGHAPSAAFYEGELPKARALVARLRGR